MYSLMQLIMGEPKKKDTKVNPKPKTVKVNPKPQR